MVRRCRWWDWKPAVGNARSGRLLIGVVSHDSRNIDEFVICHTGSLMYELGIEGVKFAFQLLFELNNGS